MHVTTPWQIGRMPATPLAARWPQLHKTATGKLLGSCREAAWKRQEAAAKLLVQVLTARWRGVSPWSVTASTAAPNDSSSSTTLTWPSLTAECSGVQC